MKHGFRQLTSDNCVFIKKQTTKLPDGSTREETLIIGCYVDDLFVLYSHNDSHSLYNIFTTALQSDWNAEDEGEVTDLLNVEISSHHGVVELKQSSYIERLAQTHLLNGLPSNGEHFSAKTVRTPAGSEIVQDVADALSARSIPDA